MADDTPKPENPEVSEKSEEELLDEWQNMADSEAGDGEKSAPDGESGERILDQNEIDSLLGTDGKGGGKTSGIKALLDSNVVNYERLPMLEILFDKFERLLSTSLRHFTADNVEINIQEITSVRFEDYLDTVPLPAGLVVVDAVGLDDYILLVYESRLIYAVVDILLGGRKARPARIEGRSFTSIERRMVENLTQVVLKDLSDAFAPVAPIKFQAERMEVNTRFATITRPSNATILITVKVNLEERDGTMQFCMPYATLEPVREQLLQQFMGEKFGQDNIWENHLAQELYHTHIEIDALLGEVVVPLKKALEWRIGDTVELDSKTNSFVDMRCGETLKLRGTMGKSNGYKAIRITHNISDINNEQDET